MTKYRQQLPQLADKLFVTDGGLETVLVFQQQIELPEFASIDLLQRKDGPQIIKYCSWHESAYVEGECQTHTSIEPI